MLASKEHECFRKGLNCWAGKMLTKTYRFGEYESCEKDYNCIVNELRYRTNKMDLLTDEEILQILDNYGCPDLSLFPDITYDTDEFCSIDECKNCWKGFLLLLGQ